MNIDLTSYKQVAEVRYANEAQDLLKKDWLLIGVYQRAFTDGEADVVYVLVKD